MKHLTIRIWSALVIAFAVNPVMAGTTIGAPSSGFFSKIGAFLQEMVDFLEGPWGLLVAVVSIAIAATIWALSTRGDQGMGMMGRVLLVVLVLINIPAAITALQAF
ncbi:MAG: TrbC/VirB2 family protein [Taibaiella sp.]|nr:TrbC/VirB2 family protein [Taibaiella sp.]